MQYHQDYENAFYLSPHESARFEKLRQATLLDIAAHCKFHHQTLRNKLAGYYPFTLEQFATVCELAGITPRDVLVNNDGTITKYGTRVFAKQGRPPSEV